MPTNLWKAVNYKTPVKYFINNYIREYDLSKANINTLLYQGRISQEEHDKYLIIPKQEREVKIGLWIKKDKTVYSDIQAGIIEAKRRLVYANNIEDLDIVSIKNDAMFIIGKELQYTEFPPFKFNVKNTYTVYLKLQELEIYYGDSIDPSSGLVNTNLDVKGMSDNALILHQGGMLDLICDACYKLQREDITYTMQWISGIYQDFINRNLPKEYYRDFDSYSGYRLNTFVSTVSLNDIEEDAIAYVDINRNLSIIRDLMSIIADVYHMKMRR